MLHTILNNPRRIWLRRALFQVHLWLGVALALYVVVIALSGAILVFEDEIRVASLPNSHYDAQHVAPLRVVMAEAHMRYPTARLSFVGYPYADNPRWSLYLEKSNGKDETVYADASTGAIDTRAGRLFVDWVRDLHVFLLAGNTGFVVNCAMGIGLLMLALTGAVLWWPGIRLWRRGLAVSLKHNWKRVNYDLHNAVGIWTLVLVSWWGFTAVAFLFPKQVEAVVGVFSPIRGMRQPKSAERMAAPESLPLEALLDATIARQRQISPGFLSGISLPAKPGDNLVMYVDLRTPGDFTHRDVDTFDGHTGRLVTVFHYGQKETLGDWIVWLVYPLHFGNLWGLPVKILWAATGFGLASLSVTGLLMYWNRYLGKRWTKLGARPTKIAA